MCGIFGCVGDISEENAYKCIRQIAHRGPDALDVMALKKATFAHARLSIIDLSDLSNQPMVDPSNRYYIVYNGEIYNFVELRSELEKLGYQFRTSGDTEVILYAYIEWGEGFQNKCNGMWSIAIWDDWKEELFLSRDRFGVKPLYYYKQGNRFYFASEMKAFFPIIEEKKINYSIFEKKNYFSYEATEDCCIRGIKKILAGQCGYYKNGKLYRHKWWNTLEHIMKIPNSYDEQVELLRELFLDACKIRMRSDVPIGTALSGGIDSSAVVGAMKYISDGINIEHVNQDWQHVFVASMPNTVIDETKYAEMAAKYIGLNLHKIIISNDISIDKLLDYMYICEEPHITTPIPFMQTYKCIVDNGIKVTIDGHGADELFGGYSFDVLYSALDAKDDCGTLKEIWKTYNDMSLSEYRMTYEQFTNEISRLKKEEKYSQKIRLDTLNWKLYTQSHCEVLPTLLRCYDRYSMGNGLEIRMPFLDYRVVCFAFSIPWQSKINGGYSKKIIRDMAAPFMDKEIIYRKLKIGFNSPLTEWLQGSLKEFVLDMIHSKDFYECELLNPLNVTIEVNEFYKKEKATFQDGQFVWTLLMPFLWKKAMQL